MRSMAISARGRSSTATTPCRQAEAADQHRKEGKAVGPLHGVPVGIKDIFDTGDMPTEFGSALWAGRTPRRDAAAVARCAPPAR